MARALIVGCGCRGRALGRALADRGWQVRGTSRDMATVAEIEAAGIEGVQADPDRIGTIVEELEGVSLVFWLLGSASGAPDRVTALHGDRLERLLEEIVDTPVRGVAYELSGGVDQTQVLRALELLRTAGERWHMPFEVVDVDPLEHELWLEGMLAAADGLLDA
jgi:uncharacterized protein YbjT (DUF2867 family)